MLVLGVCDVMNLENYTEECAAIHPAVTKGENQKKPGIEAEKMLILDL